MTEAMVRKKWTLVLHEKISIALARSFALWIWTWMNETGRNLTAVNNWLQSPFNCIMLSDQSTWILSVPHGQDPQGLVQKLGNKLIQQAKLAPRNIGQLVIPSFKVQNCSLRQNHWTNNFARLVLSIVLFPSQKIYPSKMLSSLPRSQRM